VGEKDRSKRSSRPSLNNNTGGKRGKRTLCPDAGKSQSLRGGGGEKKKGYLPRIALKRERGGSPSITKKGKVSVGEGEKKRG